MSTTTARLIAGMRVIGALLLVASCGDGSSWPDGSNGGVMPVLGTACDGDATLRWTPVGVVTCRDGAIRYALPDDFPPVPSGGYTSRPDWYPTLAQTLSNDAPEPTCASSEVTFTHPVVPLDRLTATIPYGSMIDDHVTPIDHAYLGITSLEIPEAERTQDDWIDVTAPADGTIIELGTLGAPTTNRVVIDHGCGVYTVYMVLNRPTGVLANAYEQMIANGGSVRLSLPIRAGEVFGQQRDNPLDFNVFDSSTWLTGFANLASYYAGEAWKPYTTDYLPFFTGDIRTAMTNSLQRTTQPRVGKIDHDVIGTASGNWFLDGTFGYAGRPIEEYRTATSPVHGGPVEGKNSYSWSHLSISPHEVDATKWILSIGWFKDPKGDFEQMLLTIPSGAPEPSALTSADGPVVYELHQIGYENAGVFKEGSKAPRPVGYTVKAGSPMGNVVIQVNDDDSLSLEFGTTFTPARRTYRR